MMHQNFVHSRTLQSKNLFSKYLKQAAMLPISLAAFCSYGSCGDDLNNQTIEGVASSSVIRDSAVQADKSVDFQNAINTINLASDLLVRGIEQFLGMKKLTASASDSIDPSERVEPDNLYQEKLKSFDEIIHTPISGIHVFSGGIAKNTSLDILPASNIGAATTDIASNPQLREIGPIELIKIEPSRQKSVLIQIGARDEFQGIIELGKTGKVQLTSTNECSKFIMLDIIGTGLTTIEEIQTQLNQLFQYTERRDHITLPFQIGTAADDIINIRFNSITALDLNLSRTNISDKDSAAATADKIDNAIIEVANMVAKFGGTKEQLNCAKQIYELQHQFSEPSDASSTKHFSIKLLNLAIEQFDAMQCSAEQADSDDVGPSQRAMFNEEFQARLGNVARISSKIPYAQISTADVPVDFASTENLNLAGTDISIKTSAEIALGIINAARTIVSDMIARLKGE
jgi:hypothetical protein